MRYVDSPLTGFSEDLVCLEVETFFSVDVDFFFFVDEPEPGDRVIPWPSTAPTTVTEDGSMRVELSDSLMGVSEDFFKSRFSFFNR